MPIITNLYPQLNQIVKAVITKTSPLHTDQIAKILDTIDDEVISGNQPIDNDLLIKWVDFTNDIYLGAKLINQLTRQPVINSDTQREIEYITKCGPQSYYFVNNSLPNHIQLMTMNYFRKLLYTHFNPKNRPKITVDSIRKLKLNHQLTKR